MKYTKYNEDWKFWVDKNSFALVWNVPEQAKTVTLPHDAMLENEAHADSPNGGNTGFRDGEVYNYVHMFHAEEADRHKTLLLKFEGVYMNAMVYVNGELAAKRPYGYSGFQVKLNDHLRYGQENEIRVQVRNGAMPNSRWYSGGGIYRDVYLLEAGETYLVPDELRVTTENLGEDGALLVVNAAVKNRCSTYKNLRLVTEVLDADGAVVGKEDAPFAVFEGGERKLSARIFVEQPNCWCEETPYLYQMRCTLWDGSERIDEDTVTFGIRTLSVDVKHGLCVNGKSVKLRGACIHHDSGVLGAATHYDAEYRRVKTLKEAGFNAIRMSHHPAAPVLLRACDELGVYVMDETFDMWNRCKSDNDYGLYFSEWWEKDVEAMVASDYNHPSVVLYSVGNEIPEIGGNHGSDLCSRISAKIKSLDATRYTLAAVNGVFAAGEAVPKIMSDLAAGGFIDGNVNDFMAVMDSQLDNIVVHEEISKRLEMACVGTDIAGYNYMTARYESDGVTYPNRVIVGSETYPPEIARNWGLMKKLSYVIGDFTWTGWDYIGEAGVGVPAYNWGEGGFGAGFPCQLAYSGDIDITGFRRPASYFREVVFGLRREPYIVVQNPYKYGEPLIKTPWVISDANASWTYPGMEGKPVVVEVYAPGDEVELFLDGKSIGRKPAGEAAGYRVLFETTYVPGTLEAVSYENNQVIGKSVLKTAGEGHLIVENEPGVTGELVYVTIENRDSAGTLRICDTMHVAAEVTGAMEVRMGSGNPKPEYGYTQMETDTWNGRALLVVRKKNPNDLVSIVLTAGDETRTLTV